MSFRRLHAACWLVFLVGVPLPVLAAEPMGELLLFQEIPNIVTASKKIEKAIEAPATVYVITRNDIRLRGYVSLKDVLRDLPGMEAINLYQSEQGTLVPVRGVVGNNKIVVLVNGMRVNPPGGEDMMFRNDISVQMAEQVEVIYGPGSTLYGQDAISAVINIVTRPVEDKGYQDLSLAYGTRDAKQGYADYAGKFGELELSAMFQSLAGNLSDLKTEYPAYWDTYFQPFFDINPQLDPTVQRWDRGVNGFVRLGDDKNSLQLWYRNSSRSSSEGGFDGVLFFTNEAIWQDYSIVIESKNRSRINEDVELESILTFNKYGIDPQTRYVWSPAPTTPGAGVSETDNKFGVGTGVTWEEKISAQVLTDLSLVGGLVISNYDILPKSTIPGAVDLSRDIISQAGDFVYYTQLGNTGSAVRVPRANNVLYQTYGLYLEANYQVWNNLTAILGGRLDKNSRYADVPFSPRAALVYQVDDHVTLKYIYTQAFVAPSPYYTTATYDNGSAINIPNPDLEPEQARSNEINLTFNCEKLALGLSTYLTDQNNLLLSGEKAEAVNIVQDVVYTDPTDPTSSRMVTHSTNAGRSQSRGFDLYGRYTLWEVSFWGSFSMVDYQAELEGVTTGMQGISKDNLRFGFTYSMFKDLWLSSSLLYRSTPVGITPAAGLSTCSPYEIDAHLIYQALDSLNVFLHLTNLTNNHYALQGVKGLIPQEPLSAILGIKLEL